MSDTKTRDRDGKVARLAGIAAFNQQRKQTSRENLVAAAIKLFCRDGYAAVGIDEIATEAGVSRVTFYRHFPTKSAVALAVFQRVALAGTPLLLSIGARNFREHSDVVQWLKEVFAADQEMQGILRVLSQANVAEADFSKQVQPFVRELITDLGKLIPAFAIDPEEPEQERRWVEAWLLIYTILDQSNHAATRSGVASDPLMIDILAEKFLSFVSRTPAGAVDLNPTPEVSPLHAPARTR